MGAGVGCVDEGGGGVGVSGDAAGRWDGVGGAGVGWYGDATGGDARALFGAVGRWFGRGWCAGAGGRWFERRWCEGFSAGGIDGYLDNAPARALDITPEAKTNTGWGNLAANLYYLGTGQGVQELAATYLREELRSQVLAEQGSPSGPSPILVGLSEAGSELLKGLDNVNEGFVEAPVNLWNGLVEQYKEMKDFNNAILSASSYYTNQQGLTGLYVVNEFESQLWKGAEKAYNEGYNGETGSSAAFNFALEYKTNQLLGMVPYSGLVSNFVYAVNTGDWTPYQKASGENAFWTAAAVAMEGVGGRGKPGEGGVPEGVPDEMNAGRQGRVVPDEMNANQQGRPIVNEPKFRGNNPRPGAGGVKTDLPGGEAAARGLFDQLTGGVHRVDPKGHLVGPNGERLRLAGDGRWRVDIPANGNNPPETVHFNP